MSITAFHYDKLNSGYSVTDLVGVGDRPLVSLEGACVCKVLDGGTECQDVGKIVAELVLQHHLVRHLARL